MPAGLEVADVFRSGEAQFLAEYGSALSRSQRQVLRAVTSCRTAVLGGHVQRCDTCDHQRIQYNSCRNRHCPKCQAMARAAWLEKREGELLPVPYFHVVFTLPHQLGPTALQNKRVVYGILFEAASQTLLEIAADPKHLGAKIGVLAVLHTWGQNLMHHPHLHCVVTGGGLAGDPPRWVHCRRSKRGKPFLAPVRILSKVFRGKFIGLLKKAHRSGQLHFHGKLQSLSQPAVFERLLQESVRKDWVVHAKPPFSSPRCVLKYLARYTHRVAISNNRLVEMRNSQVCFRYKDYADSQRSKTMTLTASEFMRRFLMHTLPSRFVRIRYYGLLANRNRDQRLEQCRQLLAVHDEPPSTAESCDSTDNLDVSPEEKCPNCQHGRLIRLEILPASLALRPRLTTPRQPAVARPPPNDALTTTA